MGHKADAAFFQRKQTWSKRKDLILSYYLEPYLPKIASQKRPILLVDGFAGPGKFDDGDPGSPVIICRIVAEAKRRSPHLQVQVLAVETDDEFFASLQTELQQFGFAEARHSRFLDTLQYVERAAMTHSVFLYVDPWTVEGLEWAALERIFEYLHLGRSVEILLNFNASSFVRRALAALKRPQPDALDDEDERVSTLPSLPLEKLNEIAGGEWWQPIALRNATFSAQVEALAKGFCDRLRLYFQEVCMHAVKERSHHEVPKYYLIFGSRSVHGLKLMNDATVKSRDELAASEQTVQTTLWEMRPVELVPDTDALPGIVLNVLARRMTRGKLIELLIRANFGVYRETQIRQAITQLVKTGEIVSATGGARINDQVEIWRPSGET